MGSSPDVLVVIEGEIATTQLIEQILKNCIAFGVRYKTRFLDELRVADFAPHTIPLFIRCGDPVARTWTDALSKAGRPYVYYIDDNFWRIVGSTPLAAYYRHRIVRRSLEFSVTHAQTVITSSAELARFISRFNHSTVVLPTF